MHQSALGTPVVPFINDTDFERLRHTRHRRPEAIRTALSERVRRPLVRDDGRLLIIAADHPARGALGLHDTPMAMANRYELLQRLALALSRPGVDGVLATSDVIEDLSLLGLLNGKIVVGSMNRGGLCGSVFEIDDRYTGYDVDSIVEFGLDAGKLLLRVNLEDRSTVQTMESSARAVTEAARLNLPIILEPFMSEWLAGRLVNNLSTEAVIRSIAIASGLGATSAYSWLKVPVIKEMERVMEATTLPTLLLGGDVDQDPRLMYETWRKALSLPGVRGLIAGRTLLYPSDGDVTKAVDTAVSLVHGI